MATTQEEIDQGNKDFGESFDTDMPPKDDVSDDDAFGLSLPEADDAAAEGDGLTESTVVAQAGEDEAILPEEEAAPEGAELPAEPPAEEVADAQAEAEAGTDAMPEMTQSEKSWEGRLRKREEELKAMAAELDARKNSPAEGGEMAAEESAESPAEEVTEGTAGEGEEAMRQLSEDFGPEFVKMVCAIAAMKAEEAAGKQVNEVRGTLKDVIDDIKDSRTRRHFEAIYKAHPDFEEVSGSDEFNSWMAGMPPEQKTDADRVVNGGSADEINELLSEFKASTQSAGGSDSTDEEGLDAAEGVRSTGLRLPDAPAGGDDNFKAAWDEFA